MLKSTVVLSLLLIGFWLLNSGMMKTLILFMGLASIILVLFISGRMNVIDQEGQPFHMSRRLPGYYLWLLRELVMSNIDVIKHIWMGNNSISPALARIDVNLHTDISRVIYANSVTLTPGTVAIDIDKDSMLVHALVSGSIDELRSGVMEEKVQRLEE